MSEMIVSIHAEADRTETPLCDESFGCTRKAGPAIDELPAHSFPGRRNQNGQAAVAKTEAANMESTVAGSAVAEAPAEEAEIYDWREEKRRRATYRGRTIWMLRQYMRYSMETGRLPSLLGREFFRAKVTRQTPITFEDRVIYVHDMDTCLHKLDEFSQKVIGRIVLQEYSQEEAAQLLGCARMTLHRVLVDALDRLSSILLSVGLMERAHWRSEKSCQGGNSDDLFVSDSK